MKQINSISRENFEMLECFDFDIERYRETARETLRPELFAVLEESSAIQRFQGVGLPPETINGETNQTHILRLLCRLESLELPTKTKDDVMLLLLIHDLPETRMLLDAGETKDMTATHKALSPEDAAQVEITETDVAKEIFNERELELYEELTEASGFLKGHRNLFVPTAVGIISKVLDKVDADLFYHKAAIAGLGELDGLVERGQGLAFEQYFTFSRRLKMLSNSPVAREAALCQKLLNECLLSIIEMWSEVPEDKIPQIIKENLREYRLFK